MSIVNQEIKENKEKILKEISRKKILCDEDTIFDLEKIAIGAFSPLSGFMTEEEMISCVEKMRLPDGSVWTLPILLQVRKKDFERIEKGEKIGIAHKTQKIIGFILVLDKLKFDPQKIAEKVFQTKDERHPGVYNFIKKGGFALGGRVGLLKRISHPYSRYEYTPFETRKIFQKNGWKTITAFQTRNPPHRAHEYLQRLALEITDGLLIHPILGRKKQGDFSNKVILKSYEIFIKKYYPEKRVLLSGLTTPMRYAGPREAVFHAIVRKNYGCTHFIVGRDHAGVGNYYDPYSAHRIFEKFENLGIEIIKVHGAFYCKICDGMASLKTCAHSKKNIEEISMSNVRNLIYAGKKVHETFLRKEVYEILKKELKK